MFLTSDQLRPSDVTQRLERNFETGELPFSYRLFSVVSHYGSSTSGHYKADVFKRDRNCWYIIDDHKAERTTEREVRSKRKSCAYIYFYLSR